MKLIILLLSAILIGNSVRQNLKCKDFIQNLVNTWNEKTFDSIGESLSNSKDSLSKSLLSSTLAVLKSTLNSSTGNNNRSGLTDKSLRYKFLRAISQSKKLNSHFFIIESQSDGEVVQLTNYLISNSNGKSHITIYSYTHNEWKRIRQTAIKEMELHMELKNKFLVSSNGINSTNVTLTEFNNNNIATRYYIPLSIEKSNPLVTLIQ